jgi:hypothetical protein
MELSRMGRWFLIARWRLSYAPDRFEVESELGCIRASPALGVFVAFPSVVAGG